MSDLRGPRGGGPILYAKRAFIPGGAPGATPEALRSCDFVIIPARDVPPGESFVDQGKVLLAGKRYSVFARVDAREAD
jgi:hypothetical protein